MSPIPSLEQPLQAALRGPRPSHAACGQLLAAAEVLSGGALLLSELHLPGEVATALALGGSLLVAAGTPLLPQLVSRSQALLLLPRQASSAAPGITCLLNAAAVLAGAVLPLGREAPHTAARRALLKGAFAPRRILPFLAAMLAAVEAAAADPSGELKTGIAAMLVCMFATSAAQARSYCSACCLPHHQFGHCTRSAALADAAHTYPVAVRLLVHLLEGKECAKQQAALLADRPLLERLLALLRHSLATAADSSAAGDLPGASLALQLLLSGLAAALISTPLFGQLQRLLTSDAGAALATVRDAAAVLRQLPLQLQVVGAQELWSAHGSAAFLLGRLVCLLPGRPPPATRDGPLTCGPPPPPEVERSPLLRQVGHVAVDTLPALAAAAAALARLSGGAAERRAAGQQGSGLLGARPSYGSGRPIADL